MRLGIKVYRYFVASPWLFPYYVLIPGNWNLFKEVFIMAFGGATVDGCGPRFLPGIAVVVVIILLLIAMGIVF